MRHSIFNTSIMKRWGLFFALFLAVFETGLALAESDKYVHMATDMARISRSGKLTVAMIQDEAPPFIHRDNDNKLTGIDVELIYDIADKLSVEVTLDRTCKTYDQVIQRVYEGKADIGISALSDTLDRAKWVRFTVPYWSLRQALFINRLKLQAYKNFREHDDIRSLLNQKGIRIGVIEGSSYVYFAQKDFPLAETFYYEDISAGIADTKKGNIMAFLYDEAEIINWNKAHPEDSLLLSTLFITDRKDTLAFAVAHQNQHLLSWLNLYIEKSRLDFLAYLRQKYTQSQ